MTSGPPVFSIDVSNFALITYAVPAPRVQARLPDPYELETFDVGEGSTAFVTTTCFCNNDFRPAVSGWPRHTFNESTYRTYVSHRGRRGVYFFGRYLGTKLAHLSQRTMARHTYLADFEVATDRSGEDFKSYVCHATSAAGETSFAVQAEDVPVAKAPFRSGEELAQFFTYRLHGFYTSSVHVQGYMPVDHPRMRPVAGVLSGGKSDLWTELEILSPEEILDPYSVLIVPDVPFTLFAPRPLV